MTINVPVLLSYIFSVLFLLICALSIMLYSHRVFAFALQTFLRYCVLPSSSRLRLGGVFFSPLSCRLFIKGFFYQDENLSLRVVDGHVSFIFWDSWWGDPSWTGVSDFMLTDDLKGMRCRVKVKKKWVGGVIVSVLRAEKKLEVQLDCESGRDVGENSAVAGIAEESHAVDVPLVECSSLNNNFSLLERETQLNVQDGYFSSWGTEGDLSPGKVNSNGEEHDYVHVHVNAANASSESTALFNVGLVEIPQEKGKFRVHLNGMGLCLYNATWNYENTAQPQNTTDANARDKLLQRPSSRRKWALKSIFGYVCKKKDTDSDPNFRSRTEANGITVEEYTSREGALDKAISEQYRLKSTKNAVQRFYDFIGAVEVELFASYIDIGAVGATHPYFLHIGFKRAECHNYLTQDGVPRIDLYRFVSEMTIEEMHMCWCPISKESQKLFFDGTDAQNNVWYRTFGLMLRGTSSSDMPAPVTEDVSSLISNYGLLFSCKEKSTAHVIYYRDAPNVYAGEEVDCKDELPRTGYEIFIDSPEICYGPWSHYSLTKLKEFFFPITYQPLEPLKFELGRPRPLAGFELSVQFLRDTRVAVPFKRKSPAPSPPFGISDSGRKGVFFMTLGAGSRYVQKPQVMLYGDEKQRFEGFFKGHNVALATNGIHDESTVLAKMRTLELFIDREDDRVYNGRKLWNILFSLSDAEIWWHMDYVAFFMDFLYDYQFVPEMYHGKPLTTETYNTYDRFVKEFIPNVMQFEVLLSGNSVLHLNSNLQNVIFGEDANDKAFNSFLSFSTDNPGHFSMTFPNDTYLLSVFTEVTRPYELVLKNLNCFLSLPGTHPLHSLVNSETPFAQIDEVSLKGSQIVYIPNQAVPQDKNPIDFVTGQTKHINQINTDIQVVGLRGFAMATHISALIDVCDNLFGTSCCVIRPDELFWPLSKIQPKLNVPKNVRHKFNMYLQKDEPPRNIYETSLTVGICGMDVTLQTAGTKSCKLNLSCGTLSVFFLKLCDVNDLSIAVAPIAARFFDPEGASIVDGSYLCCGDCTVNMMRHYGPLPLKTLFHATANIMIGGISFNVTVEQLAMLTQLLDAFTKQFSQRDRRLLEEIEKARTRAEYATEDIVFRAARSQANKNNSKTNTAQGFVNEGLSLPTFLQTGHKLFHEENTNADVVADVRLALQSFLMRGGFFRPMPFSETVSEAVTTSFCEYLALFEKAADETRDYAVFTMLALLKNVSGLLRVGDDGYLELRLPNGVQLASSTLNDLKSNTRMSVAICGVALCGYCRLEGGEETKLDEDFVEVFHVRTSLRVRHCTAYPFEDGLEQHLKKQKQFVSENDVRHLFLHKFFSEEQSLPHSSTCLDSGLERQPQTCRDNQLTSIRSSREKHVPGTLRTEECCEAEPLRSDENAAEKGSFNVLGTDVNMLKDDSDVSKNSLDVLSEPRLVAIGITSINTSQRFETCLSMASVNDTTEEENENEAACDFSSSSGNISNDLSPITCGGSVSLSNQQADIKEAKEFTMRPFEPLRSFLRPFFLHSHLKNDDVTLLRYSSLARCGRGGFRNFTCCYAPLPYETFFAAMEPHKAPSFLMAEEMLNTAFAAAADNDGGGRGGDDSDEWATRQADNSRHSREGATSKHMHIEAVAPLTMLLTKQFFETLYINAEMRFLTQVHNCQTDTAVSPDALHPTARRSSATEDADNMSCVGGRAKRQRKVLSRELSKNRTHQKRWLSEVKIVSVIIPCVEVRAITEVPLSSDNLISGAPANGVYTTIFIAQSFQFVMQRTLPPVHASILHEKTALSASVMLSSLALITQVEYEPFMRKGNLYVKIPGIVYEEEKDTIFVSYITSVCGRGKRDKLTGMGNGTCRVTIDTTSFHITRDFFCYIDFISKMLLQLHNMRQNFYEKDQFYHSFTNQPSLPYRKLKGICSIVFPKIAQLGEGNNAAPEQFGIQSSIVIQGLGSINTFRVELVDVYREGEYICVKTEHSNVIELKQPSAKFLAKLPIKQKCENGIFFGGETGFLSSLLVQKNSFSFCQDLPRQRLRRDVEVQFVGDVELLRVKCYPSIFHIIDVPKTKEMTTAEAKNGSVKVRSQYFPAIICGLFSTSDVCANDSGSLGVVFKGSSTLHHLDVSMLHSELNYLQFKGTDLTGYGESRTEHISSRECVQPYVLIEAISERIRRRLRHLAQVARMRAMKSCYTAPPSVIPQLHLRNSAFFFADTIFFQYVADAILLDANKSDGANSLDDKARIHEESCVFGATATQLALNIHQTDQNKLAVTNSKNSRNVLDRKVKERSNGVQLNVQLDVGKILLLCPYRPQASATVQPQLHQWLQGWLKSTKIFKAMRSANFSTKSDNAFTALSFDRKIYVWCCVMQVREMLAKMSFGQKTMISLKIPTVSAFLNFSSDDRLSLKAHIHPFTLLLRSYSAGRHVFGLPSIYIVYFKDETKRSGVCLMESVDLTLSPSVISNLLLIFDKLMMAYKTSFELCCIEGDDVFDIQALSYKLQQRAPSLNLPRCKGRFVFLLGGLCVSHLTSMTNLRFSFRKFNAMADVLYHEKGRVWRVVTNVAKAQIAIVDRDDYDRLRAASRQAAVNSCSDSIAPSTQVALFYRQSVSPKLERSTWTITPLGGFIWGLFEASVSLSLEQNKEKKPKAELENIIAALPGRNVDPDEIERLGKTVTRWNIAIKLPLIIARAGLVPLLQHSIDETRDAVERMRLALQQEGHFFRRQLFKHAAYRRLARVKKRMAAEFKRSEHDKTRRITELAAQVTPKSGAKVFLRRLSFLQSLKADDGVSGDADPLFESTSENKFFVTVSDFIAIMPFGDATYRSVVEGQQDIFVSTDGAPTLNRKLLVPTMALKLMIEKITFACSFVNLQHCDFVIQSPPAREDGDDFFVEPKSDVRTKTTFTARLVLNGAYFYCSDGSPLSSDILAKELLNNTHVLGGLGTLTSLEREEYTKSSSKVSITSIEIPFYVSRSGDNVIVKAALDISAPYFVISTRFIGILRQIMREFEFQPFVFTPGVPAATGATKDAVHSKTTSSSLELFTEGYSSGKRRHADPVGLLAAAQEKSKSSIVYSFDATAHIENGAVTIFSLKKDPSGSRSDGQEKKQSQTGKAGWSRRRGVKFYTGLANKDEDAPFAFATSSTAAGCLLTELVTLPTPEVIATIATDTNDDQEIVLHLEVQMGTVAVGPSSMSFAQDIEEWATVHVRDNSERIDNLIAFVSRLEKDSAGAFVMLHCSFTDFLLPLPRAFAMALANSRSTLRSSDDLQCKKAEDDDNSLLQTLFTGKSDPSHILLVKRADFKKRRCVSVHIHLTRLHILLTTEPVSNIIFSIFLDKHGGSVDFVVKYTFPSMQFCHLQQKTNFVPSNVIFFLSLRRLRLECQAKLDVKSLEMFLSEFVMCVAVRKQQHAWRLKSICFHISHEVADGAVLDLTVRVTHASQLFILRDLWQRALTDCMNSICRMFERGGDYLVAEKSAGGDGFQRQTQGEQSVFGEKSLVVICTASHVRLQLDLGTGNAHQLLLGGVSFALQRVQPAALVYCKTRVDVMLRSFMLHSEGALSGMANIDNFFLKGFLIENGDELLFLTRSPTGRTFRGVLCVQRLHVKFKERQVKDVFECQVTEFSTGCMDGIDEFNDMTVRADVSLYKSSFFVTPSTTPVFIGAIKSFSELVADQRMASAAKLEEGSVRFLRKSTEGKFLRGFNLNKSDVDRSAHVARRVDIPTAVSCNPDGVGSNQDTSMSGGVGRIPFMGNVLSRIPCGEIQVRLEQATVMLGSDSGGVNSSACLIVSFPKATLGFAECLAEENNIVKKALEFYTEDVEIYRPGAVKVLILGFRGINKVEFYSQQVIGEGEVGFMLSLDQTYPWTGNPRPQDFQEMIQMARSFTATNHAEVLHHFGAISHEWAMEKIEVTSPASTDESVAFPGMDKNEKKDEREGGDGKTGDTVDKLPEEERSLKALCNVQFSPQLRFGGDIAVDIDVILYWLGITEKMLPHIFHVKACDRLESLLNVLAKRTDKRLKNAKNEIKE